jgi:hypothetical protein
MKKLHKDTRHWGLMSSVNYKVSTFQIEKELCSRPDKYQNYLKNNTFFFLLSMYIDCTAWGFTVIK